jgi:hypothetical protein
MLPEMGNESRSHIGKRPVGVFVKRYDAATVMSFEMVNIGDMCGEHGCWTAL